MAITEGSEFPTGIEFAHVPIDLSLVGEEDALSCNIPTAFKVDKVLEQNKGGKVLFVAVPGAFTPTCTANHIPPFLEHLKDLKAKGVTEVVVLSANDPFVLNAWAKLLIKNAKISGSDLPTVAFALDPNAKFSSDNLISLDLTAKGLGVRTARYAFVVDADSRKVSYYGVEPGADVLVSGYDAVVAKL